jgi:hypothetical protein
MNTNLSQIYNSASYPHGIDYEWYGLDSERHIAVFTTAGIGPIPIVVLAQLTTADRLADYVWQMPSRGEAIMLVSLPRPDDYVYFASRGFFSYDWADVYRTREFTSSYEIHSKPERSIRLTEMPSEFHDLLRATAFESLRFSDSPTIQDTVNLFR